MNCVPNKLRSETWRREVCSSWWGEVLTQLIDKLFCFCGLEGWGGWVITYLKIYLHCKSRKSKNRIRWIKEIKRASKGDWKKRYVRVMLEEWRSHLQSRSAQISWVNWEGRTSSLWSSPSLLQLEILQALYKLETSMHKKLIWDGKVILLVSHQATVDANTSELLLK